MKTIAVEDIVRGSLPLNGPSAYRVNNMRVITRSIELDAVSHCNLSCKACSHSSPNAYAKEMSPEAAYNDLLLLSKFMHVENVRVVGGEPLLHSNLVEFMKAIKASGICDFVCLVTNGVLLDSINYVLFDWVDEVQISLYPLRKELMGKIWTSAHHIKERTKSVSVLEYTFFREPTCLRQSSNTKLVADVYATCQIAHFWRCITVDNGFIYRCPQSMVNATNVKDEGLNIALIKSLQTLISFLESPLPLTTCKSCLGSVGKIIAHEQILRTSWEDNLSRISDEAVDMDFLKTLLVHPHSDGGCMKRHKL